VSARRLARSLIGPRAIAAAALAASVLGAIVLWNGAGAESDLVAAVERGDLTATLTATGSLKPIQSITYRSPVPGREVEIRELAPEGAHVKQGDLIVRLDATELATELDRARQERRQAQIDLQVAEGEWEEARAAMLDVSEGEGALSVEEAQSSLQRVEKKVLRLTDEYSRLRPLLEKGVITRDELARTQDQLEEAEEELALARKRTAVVVQLAHPREQKRASLQLAQRTAQLAHARTRAEETDARVELLIRLIAESTIRARGPGLVVYEELLSALPRRKVRVGDRVHATQGIVTIPEVDRMLVQATVGEAEVHRLQPGQPATVRLEAFPDLHLAGRVSRVGALASASPTRPFDERRFDLMIELDPSDAELRPEMTARADVIVGVRKDVLLLPVTAVFERNGSFTAYVVGRRGLEPRPIELGQSNDRQVEVAAGLREGERVSLAEPPGAAGSQPGGPFNAGPRR
jgi:multidrug efflux pump subunit AcrA (membrane-fusion protein)